ncbi:molybdopterin-guanine dinucleotide biosynthesis protein B [Halobacillus seohaensis]|uniref:Molybdopterin-guanine dinucleotide biosynthesis protein B n=1 Tax=Halobacillus seohaensis TaxID=447421 RepID=A0ABW2EPK2_9BACI
MGQPAIFQIVGYKNSGKTTLLSELIRYGNAKGNQVAVIKHHGHRTPLKPMKTSTDSDYLHQCGSLITTVTSPDSLQLQINKELPLVRIIEWYKMLEPDVIFIEGYKQENYHKTVIIKDKEDIELLKLTKIQMVFTWDENLIPNLAVPVYNIHHWKEHIDEIYSTIEGGN